MEDYFARINTALTRGKYCVKIAVLHPIESYWLYRASKAETNPKCDEMEERFQNLCKWLITGSADFDYIAESLLEDLCKEGTNPLNVGEMKYDTIVVADCITLRPYTIKFLNEFKNAGGGLTENLIYQLRQDGNIKWLFLAQADMPELPHTSKAQDIEIKIKGMYVPVVYDALHGKVQKVSYKIENGITYIYTSLYDLDSLLLNLEETNVESEYTLSENKTYVTEINTESCVEYSMDNPNVLVLDMAQYRVNGGEWQDEEEVLRIDEKVRVSLGLTTRRTKVVQPWAIEGVPEDNTLDLRFKINSEIQYIGAMLAVENTNKLKIRFNGKEVCNTPYGWYTDTEIKTVKLPDIKAGENVLEISMPFGLRTDLESCYLLGDFGTKYTGCFTTLTKFFKKLLK